MFRPNNLPIERVPAIPAESFRRELAVQQALADYFIRAVAEAYAQQDYAITKCATGAFEQSRINVNTLTQKVRLIEGEESLLERIAQSSAEARDITVASISFSRKGNYKRFKRGSINGRR